eukprot:7086170-Lingulodinium_polyedra.AAC.1
MRAEVGVQRDEGLEGPRHGLRRLLEVGEAAARPYQMLNRFRDAGSKKFAETSVILLCRGRGPHAI